MQTTHINLTGVNSTGYDKLVVPADAPIFNNPTDLAILEIANVQCNSNGMLQVAQAWDHPIYGRSIISWVMQDVKYKDAHREPGTPGNVFTPDVIVAPTVSTRRGSAYRKAAAKIAARS